MFIPYAQTYTATMRGRVLKSVTCEQCRAEYVYSMEREAVGQGTSLLFLDNEGASGRASSDAERTLQRTLEQDCDPVPCPTCGWYQIPMVALLRKQHHSWMVWAGGLLLIASLVDGIIFYLNMVDIRGGNPTARTITGAILLVAIPMGLGFFLLRRILAAQFDPNLSDVNTRKQIASDRALLREELERILEEERRTAGEENAEG
jgi:hypothetical protein